MTKKHSNLPENVLPHNQSFDTTYNITENRNTWDPLRIEMDYMSPKEKKRREKLMERKSRKDKRRNKKEKFIPHEKEMHHTVKTNCILTPRSERQKAYINMLEDPYMHIVFGVGPAGSGKTYIATKWAALALQNDIFDKIIITRPTVSVSEKIGFLPGTLEEKMEPWLMPIIDVLEEVFGKQKVESFIRLGKIEIAPLAFMRGRTFKQSIILLDEAQNCTTDQFKMFLTRIGEGSKMVVTGDMKQSDFKKDNGLSDFISRLKKVDGIDMIKFDNSDIQRHHLIGTILEMYGDTD